MSRSSIIGKAEYEAEGSFAENVSTFATAVPIVDRIDVSGLTQAKIDAARVVGYRNSRTMPIRGVRGGQFSVRLHLWGHGSATSGATSASVLGTLLGNAIGTVAVSASSGTTATAGADADSLTTAASGTFSAGSLTTIGTLGDGRGNGQWAVVASHSGTAMELTTAIDAAPTNGDVVYSADNIYPDPDAAASITSTRWRLSTANQVYICRGCVPMSIAWETPIGGSPAVTITYNVAYWEESATGGTGTGGEAYVPAPIAAGSFYMQAHGTTTRALQTIRSISITHELGTILQRGPGGVWEFQDVIGAIRGPDSFMVSLTVDAQTASATPTIPGYWDSDSQFYHALMSFNGAASGKRVGVYLRKCYFPNARPVQIDDGGVNRFRFDLMSCTDEAGSNALTRAGYVIGLG